MKISFDDGKTFHNLQSNGGLTLENVTFDPLGNVVIKFYCNLNDGNGEKEIVLQDLNLNCSLMIYLDSIKFNFDETILDIFIN